MPAELSGHTPEIEAAESDGNRRVKERRLLRLFSKTFHSQLTALMIITAK